MSSEDSIFGDKTNYEVEPGVVLAIKIIKAALIMVTRTMTAEILKYRDIIS